MQGGVCDPPSVRKLGVKKGGSQTPPYSQARGEGAAAPSQTTLPPK